MNDNTLITNFKEMPDNRILLFMDVLGATNIIQGAGEKALLLAEITGHFLSGNRNHTVDYKEADDGYTDILSFQPEISSSSDYIIISYPDAPIPPVDEHTKLLVISSLVSFAAKIHFFALQHGLLMRGAIASGWQHHKGNHVIGEAQSIAVKLEKELAKYPRVIIQDKLIPLFTKYVPDDLLRLDRDEMYFIDYLRHYPAMFGNGLRIDAEFVSDLLKIRHIIERELFNVNSSGNARAIENWSWLAQKFNDNLDYASKFKSIKDELSQIKKFALRI